MDGSHGRAVTTDCGNRQALVELLQKKISDLA